MAKKYNGGIPVPTSIRVDKAEPSDDRDVVEVLNDLKTLNYVYPGIIVKVESESYKQFFWNGQDQTNLDNWVKVGLLKSEISTNHVGDNSDLDDVILNGLYPITDFPIGTIHIEKDLEWLGMYGRITSTEWLRFQTDSDAEQRYLKKINALFRVGDVNGIEQFNVNLSDNQLIQLVGGTFDPANKRFSIDALQNNSLFVNNSGNDSTAEPLNSKKPFRNFDTACQWLLDNTDNGTGWTIFLEGTTNATFEYTLLDKEFNNLKVHSFSRVNLYFRQSFRVTSLLELKFSDTYSNVYFDKNDNFSATIGSAFVNGNFDFDFNLVNLHFINTQTGAPTVTGRGYFRGLINIREFDVTNFIIGDGATTPFEHAQSNGVIRINKITNNNTYTGYDFATGLITDTARSLSFADFEIGEYLNTTSTKHDLFFDKLVIKKLTSPNVVSNLNCVFISLNSDLNLNNFTIQTHYTQNPTPSFNGNGFTIYVNHTIASILFSGIRQVKSEHGYSFTTYNLFSNTNIVVDVNSLTTFLHVHDVRINEKGKQFIYDNCELQMNNNCKLIQFQNLSVYDLFDYQIIFRNQIKIKNNNYLAELIPNQTLNANVIVSEGANIYHDFAQLSADAGFQTVIPNIKTY